MTEPLHVVAVTRKPDSASFEQRVLGYVEALSVYGIHVTSEVLPASISGQRRLLRALGKAAVVWWHRHLLSPLAATASGSWSRRAVFDMDDPLWESPDGPSWSRRRRFTAMLRRCRMVLAASDYLAAEARKHARSVQIIPMAVTRPDLVPEIDRPVTERGVELLWLGQASTQAYLEALAPVLRALGGERRDLRLRLVSHRAMDFGPMPVDYRPWSPQQQDLALRQCHIGLCPLPDDPWTRGKCPYKVLQYMAYGMPWVASAVGQNRVTAGDGVRGITVEAHRDWHAAILRLADDAARRHTMGHEGQRYVREHHDRMLLAQKLAQALCSVVE